MEKATIEETRASLAASLAEYETSVKKTPKKSLPTAFQTLKAVFTYKKGKKMKRKVQNVV